MRRWRLRFGDYDRDEEVYEVYEVCSGNDLPNYRAKVREDKWGLVLSNSK
jgi:hypothetical protein